MVGVVQVGMLVQLFLAGAQSAAGEEEAVAVA